METLLATKTASGGGEPNIFVQLEEPTTKKGIWLRTNKTAEHYIEDTDVVAEPTWLPADTNKNIPYSFISSGAIDVGTDIYMFGGASSSSYTKAYKYDTLTDTYTQLANIPYNFYSGGIAVVGNDIYLLGGYGNKRYNYKYNISTNSYTQLTNIPYDFMSSKAVAIGTDIYLVGSANSNGTYTKRSNYKYDTLTDTYTELTYTPLSFYSGGLTAIGNDIYLFGGADYQQVAYKYNILNDTYTQLTSIPYSFYSGAMTSIGTDIYLLGGLTSGTSTKAYKYNTLTDSYTQIESIPYNFYNGSAVSISGIKIYVLGGNEAEKSNRTLLVGSKDYETDNTVVITEGNTYKIELFNSDFEDDYKPKYKFNDAFFYTLEDGLDGSMPVYYGDGTQWINIKNPVNSGGEE